MDCRPTPESSPLARHRGRWASACACLLALLCAPPVTWAGKTTASLRVVSDYIERSYSRSDAEPALQAQVSTLLPRDWFMGLGASSVNLAGAEFELSPYVGTSLQIAGDWRATATVAGYLYESEILGREGHYVEPSASLQFRDVVSLVAGVAVAPYGLDESIPYAELELRYPLSDVTRISAKGGYEASAETSGYDYGYWNAGITHYCSSNLALDLRYYGARPVGTERRMAPGHSLFEGMEITDRLSFSVSFGISDGF